MHWRATGATAGCSGTCRDAKTHLHERREFVERLQAVARERQARGSFMSGDVHVAGVGRFYSRPKVGAAGWHAPCAAATALLLYCWFQGGPLVVNGWPLFA